MRTYGDDCISILETGSHGGAEGDNTLHQRLYSHAEKYHEIKTSVEKETRVASKRARAPEV